MCYITPQLKPILDVTYGCMVYQEQVMQIVRDLAGYSMGRSDLVRRAMAKKKHDVMAREKQNFINGLEEDGKIVVPGCVRNGISAQAAEQIFDEMTAFASYAFNKSHAAAYAVVAVQTGMAEIPLSGGIHGGADEFHDRQYRKDRLLHSGAAQARRTRAAAGREPFHGKILRGLRR